MHRRKKFQTGIIFSKKYTLLRIPFFLHLRKKIGIRFKKLKGIIFAKIDVGIVNYFQRSFTFSDKEKEGIMD